MQLVISCMLRGIRMMLGEKKKFCNPRLFIMVDGNKLYRFTIPQVYIYTQTLHYYD